MSNFEADLVAYLDTNSSYTAGTDLFEGPMPELPDSCVAVTHYASEESDDWSMGPSLSAPGSELLRVQLMVRHGTKATAQANGLTLHQLLRNMQGVTMTSGKVVLAVEDQGEPLNLGQDPNLRWRCASNYRVRKQPG